MFSIGDLVVYGGEGVCRVEDVGFPSVAGADRTRKYYTLTPLYRSGQVLTPVDTQVLMRPVMTPEEAASLLRELPELEPEMPPAPSMRAVREFYQQTVASYDCRRMVRLIKLASRKRRWALSHGKKVSQLDERYCRRAQEQLYGELAAAMGLSIGEVTECIAREYPAWPE